MEITEFGNREYGELAAMIRHYRKNGLWTGDGESSFTQGPSAGIVVKNTEAEIIPAYGCMEVIGTVEEDGRNYVQVKKPTSTGLLFLFNHHTAIEASGYGTAQSGPVYWVYKNSGTVTHGNRWAPTAGQYYLSLDTSGQYIVAGEDAIAANVFRVIADALEKRIKHVKAPAGGVAAFNAGTATMGSATCTEYTPNGAGVLTAASSLVCYNAAGAVAANAWGIVAMNDAGLWVWIVELC
jgi:hypothetical protein